MAAANPQWRQADGQTVLAVFAGPHAYISPTWYQAEQVVPTWNYVAVHVYGTLHIIQEESVLTEIVQSYVAFYEGSKPQPWPFHAESDYAKKLMKAITGFRVEISRMEGKWKLNQNRPREQRERVIQALQNLTDENSRAIAELIAQDLG